MPFTTLTSDGLSIVCFLVDHDWTTKFGLSLFFPGDVTAGLSDRENRYPRAEAAMLSVGVRVFAEDQEAQDLRQTFATLGKSWVGVPLFDDTFLGSDYAVAGARAFEAQRLIDLTAPAIVASTSTLVAGHTYAPLVVGHITSLPDIEPASGSLALCSATLTEDSPWDLRVGINATVMASLTAGLWPAALMPDWSSPPKETPLSGLQFERMGDQREHMIAQEERAFRWNSEAGFTFFDKTELATLLGFFILSRGTWQPFTAPMWFTPGTPTAEAPHESKLRFADSTLKIEFTTPVVAEARIKFTQVPWEIVGTAGELPQQPPRIFLYQVIYVVPTPYMWRFTNCWRPLTRPGDGTYQPGPWSHRSMSGGLDLQQENLTLDTFVPSNDPVAHPFSLYNPDILEGRLWLNVFEIETDPIDPAAAALKWAGSITAAPQDGRRYTGECKWLGGVLEREIPGVLFGLNCNTWWLSSRCGHLKSTWAKAGTLASSTGNVVVVTTADAAAANTYAPGKFEVGAGLTFESRMIASSAPVAGGQQLTLDRPLRQSATGQAVTYYIICDRTVARCKALDPSGWRARFRGVPNAPQEPLSLPSNASPATGAKK